MKSKPLSLQTRLNVVAAIILLLGLSTAISIYLTTESVSDSSLVQQFEHSKRYRHDLEVMGGKANVLADRFYRWFTGLWRGPSLAILVACLTISISSGFFFVAYHLPSDPRPDARSKNHQDGVSSDGTKT
jgi:hypothetical protein